MVWSASASRSADPSSRPSASARSASSARVVEPAAAVGQLGLAQEERPVLDALGVVVERPAGPLQPAARRSPGGPAGSGARRARPRDCPARRRSPSVLEAAVRLARGPRCSRRAGRATRRRRPARSRRSASTTGSSDGRPAREVVRRPASRGGRRARARERVGQRVHAASGTAPAVALHRAVARARQADAAIWAARCSSTGLDLGGRAELEERDALVGPAGVAAGPVVGLAGRVVSSVPSA